MNADTKVVLDACVLANSGVCDLLFRLAERPRLYVPVWSEYILDEVKGVQINTFHWPIDLAEYWRSEVRRHFPGASTSDYEDLLPELTNHEKDRHILAVAIRSGSDHRNVQSQGFSRSLISAVGN